MNIIHSYVKYFWFCSYLFSEKRQKRVKQNLHIFWIDKTNSFKMIVQFCSVDTVVNCGTGLKKIHKFYSYYSA